MKLRRTLIDNSPEGYNMTEVLKECFKDRNITEVSIATGFWDLHGTELVYEELTEFLSREGSKFRLLIGKDPYLYSGDTESFVKDKYDKQEQAWRVDLDKFAANEKYVKVVQMLVDNIKNKDNEKFQIHIYKPDGELKDQFLHSKCFIFKGYDSEEECHVGYGIIGSTNFTQKGMEGNSELNTLEINARDVISLDSEFKKDRTHLQWFNEKWELSRPWEEQFLLQVTNSKMAPGIIISPSEPAPEELEAPLTPYELYIKLLQTRFGDIVDVEVSKKVETYLPEKYHPLQYQIDAVTQCYNIMQKHGGFMLGDVVGLGKTVVGCMLIKHFLSLPDKDCREHKVLIVTPPAIKRGWEDTIADFDEGRQYKIGPHITFITTGSIGNLVDGEGDDDDYDTGDFNEEFEQVNYGLILVDESHKFRNSTTNMYKQLDALIDSISDVAPQPYVGLLSATPQNNAPSDLCNQLYLFERNRNECTLGDDAHNLEHFFAVYNNQYKHVIKGEKIDAQGNVEKLSPEKCKEELTKISNVIREKVLNHILIRRTRTDVKKYKDNKLTFPDVQSPIALNYQLNDELTNLFNETMECIAPDIAENAQLPAGALGYYRYRAIQYLAEEDTKNRYSGKGSLDTDRVANQLANIVQMLLVKRMESSKDAFQKSLANLLQYTNNMIKMWENGTLFICPDFDINKEFEASNDWNTIADNIRTRIEKLNKQGRNKKQSNAEYSTDEFNQDFVKLLRHDRDILQGLVARWNSIKSDPKKTCFRKELRKILPETEPNKKLVIFTESADTLEAIAEVVEEEIGKPLCITAKNRKEQQSAIQANFDANYGVKDGAVQKDDYRVIISTDVLAEGVNLHRAYTIINYDTPWNSTKLMQRIGRVNRIGSKSDKIYIYNFMPCDEGNKKIRLFERAFTKLQSFHTLFGEDAQVFSTDEDVTHINTDLKKHLDGEESPMMKYLFELREYKKANPHRYEVIAKKETGLEMAASTSANTGYFLVRAENMQDTYIKVQKAEKPKGEFITIYDMMDELKADVSATTHDVDEEWDKLTKEALRSVNIRLSGFRRSYGSKPRPTEAKMFIEDFVNANGNKLTEKAQSILGSAFELCDYGNTIIVNKVLRLKELYQNQSDLFGLSTQQIEENLDKELRNIVESNVRKYGTPYIYLGIEK